MTDATAAVLSTSPLVAARSAAHTNLLARFAAPALQAAAASWFIAAVAGQLVFVVYMAGFYARTAALGQFELWNKVFPRAYVPGAYAHNLVVSLHLLFTTIVIAGGALQLIPGVRRRWPRFHRWNGRTYLVSALFASLAGLVMTWTRSSTGGGLDVNLAISINALLIIAFAGLAFHHARARRIDVHRRWALRLYLAMLGAWFFRIGLMFWIIANHGPVGFDPETFRGPFITTLSFAQYLLPLLVLELYLRARDSGGPSFRLGVAAGVFVLALVTAVGVVGASMILWLPHL